MGEEAEGKEKPKEKLVRGEQRLVWRKIEWGAAVERGRKMVKWRGEKGEDDAAVAGWGEQN